VAEFPADDQSAALLARWRAEQRRPHEGWDFSHLAGRLTEEQPPWDFDAECRAWLAGSGHVLDMGTGGGERLAALAAALPADTVATEGWPPNLPVARARLAGLAVPVAQYTADATPAVPMPFPDGRFDLVMNRHESFDPAELARVLSPGGIFLTQQVGGDDFPEAHRLFGPAHRYPGLTLDQTTRRLTAAGLRVEASGTWAGTYRFHDIGALVGYFTLVPWDVPGDFSVDNYAPVLLRLHADGPARGRPACFTSTRFWLRAVRPAPAPGRAPAPR
jgi:SAM-dependent methyltransferase